MDMDIQYQMFQSILPIIKERLYLEHVIDKKIIPDERDYSLNLDFADLT